MTDVKNLLGMNVGDVKTYESASQIQQWIKLQLQSDLDTLKIGLTGGRNAMLTTAKPSDSTTKFPSDTNSTGGNSVSASTTKGKNTFLLLVIYVFSVIFMSDLQ